jgi:hypothetical protein
MKLDLLPRGQNPLSYYILYDESKHNILACQGKAKKVLILVLYIQVAPYVLVQCWFLRMLFQQCMDTCLGG